MSFTLWVFWKMILAFMAVMAIDICKYICLHLCIICSYLCRSRQLLLLYYYSLDSCMPSEHYQTNYIVIWNVIRLLDYYINIVIWTGRKLFGHPKWPTVLNVSFVVAPNTRLHGVQFSHIIIIIIIIMIMIPIVIYK